MTDPHPARHAPTAHGLTVDELAEAIDGLTGPVTLTIWIPDLRVELTATDIHVIDHPTRGVILVGTSAGGHHRSEGDPDGVAGLVPTPTDGDPDAD